MYSSCSSYRTVKRFLLSIWNFPHISESLNLLTWKRGCIFSVGFALRNFRAIVPIFRLSSLPLSAPLLALTPCKELLHFWLMMMWSIWLTILPSGNFHVTLWMSLSWNELRVEQVLQILPTLLVPNTPYDVLLNFLNYPYSSFCKQVEISLFFILLVTENLLDSSSPDCTSSELEYDWLSLEHSGLKLSNRFDSELSFIRHFSLHDFAGAWARQCTTSSRFKMAVAGKFEGPKLQNKWPGIGAGQNCSLEDP